MLVVRRQFGLSSASAAAGRDGPPGSGRPLGIAAGLFVLLLAASLGPSAASEEAIGLGSTSALRPGGAVVEPEVWRAVRNGTATFLVQLAPEAVAPKRPAIGSPAENPDVARSLGPWMPTCERLANEGHVLGLEVFPRAGWAAVLGDEAAVRSLSQLAHVLAIRANRQHRLPRAPSDSVVASDAVALGTPWHLAAIGALRAWQRWGTSGEGVVVATIDTGVDGRHPALSGQYRGRGGHHSYNWLDAVGGATTFHSPTDPHGHGTNVMGLILGRAGDRAYGVAPGARWIAVRAFDEYGVAADVALLRAAEWLLAPTDPKGQRPRPDLAPQVVNCSWVLENPSDPLFESIVAAWHAAGMVPVFAVGNREDGVQPGPVLAPATYSSTLAVGAALPDGSPWAYSRIGPGFYGGIKPDLLAPGVQILTTDRGGGESVVEGTSMAAALVSGAAATLLAARPELGVEDVRQLLCQSARDTLVPGPDDISGCGFLDLEQAMVFALQAGWLAGRVETDLGQPVAGLSLQAEPADGLGRAWKGRADSLGRYRLTLPAGRWWVRAAQPGFRTVQRRVGIGAGETTRLDWTLTPDRGGTVHGRLGSAIDMDPTGGQVVALTASAADRVDRQGSYRLALPAGHHVLRYSLLNHRAVTATVWVTAGQATERDVVLQPAPRLLVVDADAWRGERVFRYLTPILQDLGYPHQVATIDQPQRWQVEQLNDYDVVIWLQPYTSPGSLDQMRRDTTFTQALASFVSRGGRLLIAGQEIGRLDAPRAMGGNQLAPEFYRDVLGALRLRSLWGHRTAFGLGVLEGLRLDLYWPLGHSKPGGVLPDVVAPADRAAATMELMRYADGGCAALATDDGRGRRVYLAFGLESAGSPVALGRLLDALLGWLEPASLGMTAERLSLGAGEATALDIRIQSGRSSMPAELEVAADKALSLLGNHPLVTSREGRLRWEGELAPLERRNFRLLVRWRGATPGGASLPITATLLTAGYHQSSRVLLSAVGPDLTGAALRAMPNRLSRAGQVTVELVLPNRGLADASNVEASVFLPAAMEAFLGTLVCSAGECEWREDGLAVQWRVRVAQGETVRLQFSGRLPDGVGQQHGFQALVTDAVGTRLERWTGVLVGGPELVAQAVAAPLSVVHAGEPFTLPMRISNSGPLTAQARAVLALPPGFRPLSVADMAYDALAGELVWSGALAAGAEQLVFFRLLPSAEARGTHQLVVRVSDGFAPEAPGQCSWWRKVVAPDLSPSLLALWPTHVASGGLMELELLVANHGDLVAPVTVEVPMAPGTVIDPATVRASGGQTMLSAGRLSWSVTVPPLVPEYRWQRLAAGWTPDSAGSPVVPGRTELGFIFPFAAAAYTQTWLTSDGRMAFAPLVEAETPPDSLDQLPVPALVVYHRPGQRMPIRLRRDDGALAVTWGWPPEEAATVLIRRSGAIRLIHGSRLPTHGVTVGLTDGAGGVTQLPLGAWRPGGSVDLERSGGIAWLALGAHVGHGWSPNAVLRQTACLSSRGEERCLEARATVDRLSLDQSGLRVAPASVVAGGRVEGELKLVAEGEGMAREVEAWVQLPMGLRLLGESVRDGAGDVGGGLVTWRGTLAPGSARTLRWQAVAAPSLQAGTRLVTWATIRASGLDSVERSAVQTVCATDFSGSHKTAWRAVAAPGEVVTFTLRVANAGLEPVRARLTDALPDGLEFIPGALHATVRPAPSWDAAARILAWQGEVAPRSAVEIELGTRFRAQRVVTNVLRIEDPWGTSVASWAEVRPLLARRYLPLATVSGGRASLASAHVPASGPAIQAESGRRSRPRVVAQSKF